jgi:dTDP-4-dehydrorhamnose 3,5-epimerase-like enzyme
MLKNLEKFENDLKSGTLYALNKNLGFSAKRFFYVSGVEKHGWRGDHAHRQNKQLLVCVKGEILILLDNGKETKGKTLKEGQYVFVDNMVWDKQQYLTGEDILLCICSDEYDEKDYIKNYEQFLGEIE